MALALTPRLLRRGLELFAVISLIGVAVVLVVFGENLDAVLSALAHLHWGWLLVGLGLASMDWIGGGAPPQALVRRLPTPVLRRGPGDAGGVSGPAGRPTPRQNRAGHPNKWALW